MTNITLLRIEKNRTEFFSSKICMYRKAHISRAHRIRLYVVMDSKAYACPVYVYFYRYN